jgi:rubrerythrin
MTIRFTADEVLAMAEQIERNGAQFYRAAAERAGNAEAAKVLRDLAAMEDDHERTFTSMRAALPAAAREEVVFDPDGEGPLYLQAMADRQVFDVTKDPLAALAGTASMRDVLVLAIQAEKDSIAFYTGMKEIVPARYGGDRIGDVIKEEMSHLAILGGWMAKF